MAWSKDNSVAAKLAAAEALAQAQRAEDSADYIDEKQPLIDGFIGEQTNLQTQLNDLVLQSGTDIAEVVQARGGFATVNDRLADTTAQLADNVDIGGNFLKLVKSGQITKIKLIGDSITVGVGSDVGGAEDVNGLPIGTTGKKEAKKDTVSWSNFFRNYMTANFPAIEFFNAGIAGWGAKVEGLQYGTQWYGTNNDAVFVMLGTNDRVDATTEADFETSIETFLLGVDANSNHMYVMTAPPALDEFDASGVKPALLNLTMEQIDRVIAKVCIKHGWKHISFYRKMLKYHTDSKTPFENILLETNGGPHPNKGGYLFMWKTLQQELGLIKSFYDWKTNPVDIPVIRTQMEIYKSILSTTKPSEFAVNSITYSYMSSVNPDAPNFPESKGGTLKTTRGNTDAYIFQEYWIYPTGKYYTRHSAGLNAWSAWIVTGGMNVKDGAISTTLPSAFDASTVSYSYIANVNPDTVNLPEGKGGLLRTTRSTNDAYIIQEYFIYQSGKHYVRHAAGLSAWTPWVSAYYINTKDDALSSTAVTAFPANQITRTIISSAHADKPNLPEGLGGTLITHRPSNDYFAYQEFHVIYSANFYKRPILGNLTWGAWVKMNP